MESEMYGNTPGGGGRAKVSASLKGPQKRSRPQLDGEAKALQLQVDALLASSSWRITAPLRSLALSAPWLVRNFRRVARLEGPALAPERLDGEAKALQLQVDALLASSSWRITAPLRSLALSAPWLVRNFRRVAKLAGRLTTGKFTRSARSHSSEGANGGLPLVAVTRSVDSKFRLKVVDLGEGRLKGWCVDKRDLSRIFSIDLLIDGVYFQTIENSRSRPDLKAKGLSTGYGGLQVTLPVTHLDERRHTISFRLPDGEVLTTDLPKAPSSKRTTWTSPGNLMLANATSVVVPVYNAADDLAVCIARLAAYTPDSVDILFIDDASPDARIAELLAEAAKQENMRVLCNDENVGFTATINRGLSETRDNDVIILNSDARVTPGWFEGLLAAASSGPKIATVTAMSDRAGAFSAPNIGNDNDLPPGVDEITYARAFRRRALGLYPSVPTGNGFCMFISRACMDEIGMLDEEAFPGGYCEENDFCMRAVRAGWRNIIDDRTYVFHGRSKSFGEAKTDLLIHHRAVIDDRYPEFKKATAVFSDGMSTNLARFQARRALVDCATASASLPRALYVISTETGGTPQTNIDLMTALEDALDTWVLRCDSRKLELCRFRDGVLDRVQQHHLTEPVDPLTHVSFEYDAVVAEWIRNLDVEFVHIRHLAWHSLSLPQIAKAAGKKVLFSFHDYYALCPTIKLLDEAGTFCGGQCTSSHGECQPELWPTDAFPPLKDKWVHIWRKKFAHVLACCDGFVTTSDSTRARILKAIPSLPADRFWVIPHGRDFPEMQSLREIPVEGEPLRILLPGNINVPKGADIVRALLNWDTSKRLEFHVVGKLRSFDEVLDSRVHLYGEYEREDFAEKVAPIRPHLGAIFSIWDETFCHTLSELWSVGLPAIVFDFGTVASRTRESGAGWVMDHTNIGALYDEITRIAYDLEEQSAKDEALSRWQGGVGAGSTSRLMAAKYLEVYRTILDEGQNSDATIRRCEGASDREFLAPRVAVVCSEGKGSEGTAASSEGRIYDRTRNQLARDVTFIQMLPSSLLANLRAGDIDSAILQGSAIPHCLASELSCAFDEARVPYVFDLDADLLNAASGDDPVGPDAGHASVLRELFSKATVATVSTPSLHSVYRLLHSNSVLLPDKLSLALWRGLTAERQPDGFVRALYMTPGAEGANIELVRAALEEVARTHPEFRLAVIGSMENELQDWAWAERIQTPSDTGSHSRFVSWLRSIGGQFDFAIAPLANTPANAYKSPMTIFQYGGLGLPVLASDVPAYRNLARIAPGVEPVTNTAEGWTSAILRQVKSRSEDRQNEGLSLRRWVLESQALEPTLSDFDALIPLRGID